MAQDKLGIASEMSAVDRKDREYYDSLSDDEKKKFTTYLMIRWSSCVIGCSAEMQAYYLMSANQRLNKNYFAVSDTYHKKLNWLATTTISPGMGTMRHQWISAPKKAVGNSKVAKFLAALYPDMKLEDLKLLEQLNDVATWKKHAESLGYTKEQIKKELG